MPDATIRDVARRAQVSVATVSRALNGLDNVSEHTRTRVADAVRELGYVPHAGARSLSLARSGAIGVVLPIFTANSFPRSCGAWTVKRAATAISFCCPTCMPVVSRRPRTPCDARPGRRADRHGAASRRERACSGASGRPSRSPDQHQVGPRPASAQSISTIAPEQRRSSIIWSRSAASASFISPARSKISTRWNAGRPSVRGRARTVSTTRSSKAISKQQSGERAIATLLKSGARFDSVFAANDNMAIGALQALRAAGLRVPEDVAVAGFDDIPLARHIGLTTVRVRIAELGERAIARLLDDAGRATRSFDELHAPELVVRSTTVTGAPRS